MKGLADLKGHVNLKVQEGMDRAFRERPFGSTEERTVEIPGIPKSRQYRRTRSDRAARTKVPWRNAGRYRKDIELQRRGIRTDEPYEVAAARNEQHEALRRREFRNETAIAVRSRHEVILSKHGRGGRRGVEMDEGRGRRSVDG